MMLLRPALLLAACTVATCAAAQAPSGNYPPDHATVRIVAGAWDLTGPRGRKCRLQLNQRAANTQGLVLGFPTPCKATFPVFTAAQQWALARDGQVIMLASDGKEVARFARTGSGPLKATLGADAFQLDPVGERYAKAEQQQAVIAATSPPSAAAAGGARPAAPAIALAPRAAVPPPPSAEIPGPYALTRGDGREVCKVDLKSVAGPRPGQQSASFIGACSDQGLKVFDPAAWRYDNGKLHLIARRGHDVTFVFEGTGQWRKDPPTGAALGLRKTSR